MSSGETVMPNQARIGECGDELYDVVVVGAGVTGIGAACVLRERRMRFIILEGSDDVGGIWSTNRWHGARCDSDFIKYSYSFAPALTAQCHQDAARVHAYLQDVARQFDLLPCIRFKANVIRAAFDETEVCWVVTTDQGSVKARFLINGNGYFAEPHLPELPGIHEFQGRVLHTLNLDDGVEFRTSRVVVVGSGSTAICCAPALGDVAKTLTLVQRSPSYIFDIENDEIGWVTRLCQDLYSRGVRWPVAMLRYYLQCKDDAIFVLFRRFPRFWRNYFAKIWAPCMSTREFQRNFSPVYSPWEQRPTFSMGLRQRIADGRVSVHTGEISHFDDTSLTLTDGTRIPCDVCVLATGYELNLLKFDLLVADKRVEIGGLSFFKRLMLGGVPNYFQPFGTVHSAWTQSLEPGVALAVKIMSYMDKHGYRKVCIDPVDVDWKPGITPNYIMRAISRLPHSYGTFELPSLDRLFSYHFKPGAYTFEA